MQTIDGKAYKEIKTILVNLITKGYGVRATTIES